MRLSGVLFVFPKDYDWYIINMENYQSNFGARGKEKDSTLIVSERAFEIQPTKSKEEFLAQIHAARIKELPTGRFEKIYNDESIYSERPETCVTYKSASKDFGVDAKRGGQFSILETRGLYCVHPLKPIGIQVEYSRKAPPNAPSPSFDAEASALLKSVEFREF